MNTSTGFYETQTAGTSWTKVSNLPAGTVAAFANIGDGDILVCTDGRYIWRSTDIARHWTLVFDQRSAWRHTGAYVTYTNLTYPCIAGANGLAVCGFGPFLSISFDVGLTWASHPWWDHYYGMYVHPELFPPVDVVFGRQPWDSRMSPSYLIKQILISSIDGPQASDVTFLLRYDDLAPMPGESSLYSRIFKTISPISPAAQTWRYQFQQYLSPVDGAQIDAYDLPITGSPSNDKLVFSAQTRTDASGNPVPSLKYSNDGGSTWIDVDLSRISIGSADGVAITDLSFLDESFAKNTWVYGSCDNSGSWNTTDGKRRQGLSYEADLFLEKREPPHYNIDVLVSKEGSLNDSIDAVLKKRVSVPYQNDALFHGVGSKPYPLDGLLQGKVSHASPMDVIVSIDTPCTYQIDVGRIWKQPTKYYHLDALLRSVVGHTYSCDVVLVEYGLIERLSKMVGKIPQFLDLDVPDESEGAFNSSQETL
jgi:hypothetical protein